MLTTFKMAFIAFASAVFFFPFGAVAQPASEELTTEAVPLIPASVAPEAFIPAFVDCETIASKEVSTLIQQPEFADHKCLLLTPDSVSDFVQTINDLKGKVLVILSGSDNTMEPATNSSALASLQPATESSALASLQPDAVNASVEFLATGTLCPQHGVSIIGGLPDRRVTIRLAADYQGSTLLAPTAAPDGTKVNTSIVQNLTLDWEAEHYRHDGMFEAPCSNSRLVIRDNHFRSHSPTRAALSMLCGTTMSPFRGEKPEIEFVDNTVTGEEGGKLAYGVRVIIGTFDHYRDRFTVAGNTFEGEIDVGVMMWLRNSSNAAFYRNIIDSESTTDAFKLYSEYSNSLHSETEYKLAGNTVNVQKGVLTVFPGAKLCLAGNRFRADQLWIYARNITAVNPQILNTWCGDSVLVRQFEQPEVILNSWSATGIQTTPCEGLQLQQGKIYFRSGICTPDGYKVATAAPDGFEVTTAAPEEDQDEESNLSGMAVNHSEQQHSGGLLRLATNTVIQVSLAVISLIIIMSGGV